jgi:hypothetical protein
LNTNRLVHYWNRQRSLTAILYFLPVVFLFTVYWYGLKNWFEQDDFAWLGLHHQVYSFRSFLTAMFEPMAQGTIRPWSERGFFLLFYKVFQANALPYHIAVFATQTANLILLALIMRKLTGSAVAAVLAPILWTANSALLTPLCWVSDYNQIQCGFFLLTAFVLYLYDRYWLQFAVFLLGFGALELNIVYPALVLSYVLTCRFTRERVLRTVPLFLVSVLYYALHTAWAPRQSTGVYALHFDRALPATLWTYWVYAFAPVNAHQPLATVIFFTAAIAGFVLYQAWQGRRLPLFFLLWFFITLAPTLPLRDHISDYYLALPVLGLGAIFALALGTASKPVRFAALAPVAFYLFIHIPLNRFGAHWYFSHTRAVRNLVWGVRQAQQLHPGKTILLTGVSDDLYLDSFAHSAFLMLDIPDVYLSPESAPQVLRLDPGNENAPSYILPAGPTVHALLQENLIVYSAAGERLRNVTSLYERTAGERFGWNTVNNVPTRLDAAAPIMAYLLGPTWYSPEGTFRWMPARASFRIGVPKTAGTSEGNFHLLLSGYCPPEQVQSGPLTLTLLVDGKEISATTISKPETSFTRKFNLPRDLVGRESVEVTLLVNRTLSRSGIPLGLAFGVFEIR